MISTRRTTVLMVVFTIAVTLMVAIPAIRLLDPTQGRFGWHMFSRGAPAVEMSVRFEDSTTSTIVLGDHLVAVRGDIPIASYVPDALCRMLPQSVEILVSEGEVDWVVPCR